MLIEAKTRNLGNRALADTKLGGGGVIGSLSIMVSIATLEGAVRVQIDGDVTTTSAASTATTPTTAGAPAIGITSDGQNTATANVLVFAVGGLFSGNFSFASSEITSSADVEILGGSGSVLSATGLIEFIARSDNTAQTRTDVASGGFLSGGLSLPTAIVNGGTNIDINGDVSDASGVTVWSRSDNFAEVQSLAVQAGAIAIAVTVGDARVGTGATTRAEVGSAASYTVPGGAIAVIAASTNRANSKATSVAPGAGLSLAFLKSLSKVEGETVASFDGDIETTTPKALSLTVQANAQNHATVDALVAAMSLGLAVGVNTASALVTSNAKTEAAIGSSASVNVSGAILVEAALTPRTVPNVRTILPTTDTYARYNYAQAKLETIGVGTIAAGATISEAKVGAPVTAKLDGDIASSGSITVRATSDNYAIATTIFITAGLGALSATDTQAEITSTAKTEALVGSTSLNGPTGLVTVTAGSANNAYVSTNGGTGGVIGITVTLPTAKVAGATRAIFGGSVIGGTGLTAQATSNNDATVDSTVIGVALAGASLAKSTAIVDDAAVTEAGVIRHGRHRQWNRQHHRDLGRRRPGRVPRRERLGDRSWDHPSDGRGEGRDSRVRRRRRERHRRCTHDHGHRCDRGDRDRVDRHGERHRRRPAEVDRDRRRGRRSVHRRTQRAPAGSAVRLRFDGNDDGERRQWRDHSDRRCGHPRPRRSA